MKEWDMGCYTTRRKEFTVPVLSWMKNRSVKAMLKRLGIEYTARGAVIYVRPCDVARVAEGDRLGRLKLEG